MWKDKRERRSGKHIVERAGKACNRSEKESVKVVVHESTNGRCTNRLIAKAMKQEAEEEMNVLCTKPHDVFKFVKFLRKEGRGREGCKDKDGRLVVSKTDSGKLWKEHLEKIMNEENE